MRVLIACEFSKTVRDAFLSRGHDAWSCDIVKASGPHYQCDVLEILDLNWDLLIGHPPCTYLSRAGCHMLNEPGRFFWISKAADFFNALRNADIPKIAIENPIPHKHARALIGKYDQIIYPYEHGDPYTKPICLWLKNLPHIKPTNLVKPTNKIPHGTTGGEVRSRLRSVFFPGVASAMADQWGVDP